MQAALLIRRDKQRLRKGANFRELPSNLATRLIPPLPRYPPRSYAYGVSKHEMTRVHKDQKKIKKKALDKEVGQASRELERLVLVYLSIYITSAINIVIV